MGFVEERDDASFHRGTINLLPTAAAEFKSVASFAKFQKFAKFSLPDSQQWLYFIRSRRLQKKKTESQTFSAILNICRNKLRRRQQQPDTFSPVRRPEYSLLSSRLRRLAPTTALLLCQVVRCRDDDIVCPLFVTSASRANSTPVRSRRLSLQRKPASFNFILSLRQNPVVFARRRKLPVVADG